MMNRKIDIEAILAPIPGENPAGRDLRYTQVYEDIKEARRADEEIELGEWQRDLKKADYDKVVSLAVKALEEKTKDLQIAAWLAESLSKTENLEGLTLGLKIFNGLLSGYWDSVYPMIEDGDLDFRAGPIEFMNDKLCFCLKELPLTDPRKTPGYSWFKWEESRTVGYEKDTYDRYGNTDQSKLELRNELIEAGKLSAEEFDSAVAQSSRAHFESLSQAIGRCSQEFDILDKLVDEKFGSQAPRLAELRKAFEDLDQFISLTLKEKRKLEPDAAAPPEPMDAGQTGASPRLDSGTDASSMPHPEPRPAAWAPPAQPFAPGAGTAESALPEQAIWEGALGVLQSSGFREALDELLAASRRAGSQRMKSRFMLLTARLCLEAKRPDLARPIAEELHAMIEELHLDRWESPVWIAEVLDALYRCLIEGEPSPDDIERANLLFVRLCKTDVTKAMYYRLSP